METFQRVLSFARPYGRKIPGYLLLSVLSVVFGVVNYALLGPLLTVLFDNQEAAAAVARPDFAPTVDFMTEWFRWLLSSVIRDGGVVRGLLLVCWWPTCAATCLSASLWAWRRG